MRADVHWWLIGGLGLLLQRPAAAAERTIERPSQEVQQSRQDLEQARRDYRDAVDHFGQSSPQAEDARQHLRSSRQAYHTTRRHSEFEATHPHGSR